MIGAKAPPSRSERTRFVSKRVGWGYSAIVTCAPAFRSIRLSSSSSPAYPGHRCSPSRVSGLCLYDGCAVTLCRVRKPEIKNIHSGTSRPLGRTLIPVPSRLNTLSWRDERYSVPSKCLPCAGGKVALTRLHALQRPPSVTIGRLPLTDHPKERLCPEEMCKLKLCCAGSPPHPTPSGYALGR